MSTTCYIKDSNNHYTYIQPVANHQEEYFLNKEKKNGFIVKRSNVYSSPEILIENHKDIIPLYSLVMSKNTSNVELIATDKTRNFEYQMKTEFFPNL